LRNTATAEGLENCRETRLKPMLTQTTILLSRIALGGAFIFSGFVKAIDPLGSVYKLQDYFLAFGIPGLLSFALPLAVLLSTLELVIGLGAVLRIKMPFTALGGLLLMAFFTPLTLFIALTNPVPHCGCFGDAIVMSNWQTFYKNMVLLTAAVVLFSHRKKLKPLWSPKGDLGLMALLASMSVLLSLYCLHNLPLMDFRPWKVGSPVAQLAISPREEANVYLIFENTRTGEKREYPAHDYPWNDPQWTAQWTFRDQRKEFTRPPQEAAIENFYIQDAQGHDLTEFFLTQPGYLLIVVAHDLQRTSMEAFKDRITPLAKAAEDHGHPLIVLTGSSLQAVEDFTQAHQASYPFYLSDEIALKTIIRSNPGLVLMKEGVVRGKWAHRNILPLEKMLGGASSAGESK